MTQFYYDFCCRSGGNNLNAGTLTSLDTDGEPSTSPLVSYTSGTWVQATGVFTVASGNPVSDGVAVGHWASVYADGASAPTGFVGRVTARNATTITVDVANNYAGTAPTNGTNTRTLRVGGAWVGMSGASAFPVTFIRKAASSILPRINLKNDQTYSITASMTPPINQAEYAVMQGYTSAYGDGGKATIDGGTAGASYVLLNISNVQWLLQDLIFQNNGATGSATGVDHNTNVGEAVRCVFAHIRGIGAAGFEGGMYECEAYDCNQSNTSGLAGFEVNGSIYACISHHNTGSNALGFIARPVFTDRPRACVHCIADSNGSHGFNNLSAVNCDAYNNGGDGYRWASGTVAYCENSNSIKNAGWGFNFLAGCIGDYAALRYGAGTQANTSGGIQIAATAGVSETSPASAYPSNVTPWANPTTGDFRIVRSEAMGTGRGEFTQEFGGFSDVTTMYPDIGAVWHKAGMRVPKRMEGGF